MGFRGRLCSFVALGSIFEYLFGSRQVLPASLLRDRLMVGRIPLEDVI